MSTKRTVGMLGFGALMTLGLLCLPTTAEARDHHDDRRDDRRDDRHSGGGLFIGTGIAPSAEGYYVDQVQTVLVAPGHYERQWVPPVYQTGVDQHGRPVSVLVRDGYFTEYWVPDRYENRVVRVWVPAPQPTVRIGFGFRF